MDEKLVSRIKKLLNVAEGKANENESQSAMLKAQKLMAEHNISLKDVADINLDTKKVDDKPIMDAKGRLTWWEKEMGGTIALNFRCTPYIKSSKVAKVRVMMFLGLEEDVAIAIEVYRFAVHAIKRLSKDYVFVKRGLKGAEATALKNDFMGGFIRGLDYAFKQQVEKNNWGLILVKDALVVQAQEDKKMKKGKTQSGIQPQFRNNQDALREGFKRGKEFVDDTKTKKIGDED